MTYENGYLKECLMYAYYRQKTKKVLVQGQNSTQDTRFHISAKKRWSKEEKFLPPRVQEMSTSQSQSIRFLLCRK